MGQNLCRQNIHLPLCACLVCRHGIFKMPVPMCVFEGVLTLCISEYCWCISDAIVAQKFLFTRLVPVSRPGVFFNALGTFVLCRCTYFTRMWKSDLRVDCESIFLPAHCVYSWNAHLWTAPVETKVTCLRQVYFGSICFPKVKGQAYF